MAELTGERVRLRVGALYGAWIAWWPRAWSSTTGDEAHQGRPRRYYRLTGGGVRVGDFEGGAA